MSERAGDIRRALLLVLRAVESPHVRDVRDGKQLVRKLNELGLPVFKLKRLVLKLSVSTELADSPEARARIPTILLEELSELLPAGTALKRFSELSVFDEPEVELTADADARICIVEPEGRRLEIGIGTVASMKGETHLATLVLESYGGQSRRHDLAEALPVLAGLQGINPKMTKTVKGQFRNLYVAMSRPTKMLSLAANRSRVSDSCVERLAAAGWEIEHLT